MTTSNIIALLFGIILGIAAGRGWRSRNRKGEQATTHDPFRTAPRWAGALHEQLNEVLAGQRRLHQHIGSEAEADERRDRLAMSIATETLDKARAADTVSKSTNIAVKEVIRLLKENQQNPADTAALQEAQAILDGIMADDAAVLTENTPSE